VSELGPSVPGLATSLLERFCPRLKAHRFHLATKAFVPCARLNT
jgi:hypothetical protein